MNAGSNLLMFLSDRCNMACDYCFLSLNQGAATVLGENAAFAACDAHLERNGGGARFTFLGGEPFIHFPLLLRIAAYVRAKAPEAALSVVTNGTLASAERLDALAAQGVSVTVSVDGGAAAHDRHRPMAGGGPSFAGLKAAFAANCPCELKANMVVCEDTAAGLLSSVEAVRALGFARLSFHLNVLQDWSDAGLRTLRAALAGFERYHAALPDGALEVTHLPCCAGGPEEGADHGYEDLVLGADGRYYPCDAPLLLPYAQAARWAVGDTSAGVDWDKRESFHREARAFVHARQAGPHHLCARETYFHAVCSGKDPDTAVRSFLRADSVLGETLGRLSASSRRAKGECIHA